MDTQQTTTLFVRKTAPYSSTGGTLLIVGLLTWLFIQGFIGLFFAILGFILCCIVRDVFVCGECGNEVVNTSRRCPCCHSSFSRVSSYGISKAFIWATVGSLSVAGIIGFVMWWMIYHANNR